MFDKGFFGGLFDFNRDGKLDPVERATDFTVFQNLMGSSDRTELEDNGLDSDELSFMDEDERKEALEDAGLDPDDYDF